MAPGGDEAAGQLDDGRDGGFRRRRRDGDKNGGSITYIEARGVRNSVDAGWPGMNTSQREPLRAEGGPGTPGQAYNQGRIPQRL